MSELWVPIERLKPIIEAYDGEETNLTPGTRRKLSHIRAGSQNYIGLYAVDRLFSEMDLTEWFHLPQSQDGLADIYEDGAQYGRPDNRSTFVQRQEAQREYSRFYKRVRVMVACPECGTDREVARDQAKKARVTRCRACYFKAGGRWETRAA